MPSYFSPFYIASSKASPKARTDYTKKPSSPSFPSSFASTAECKDWLLHNQYSVNFINQNIMFVADARSAKDETLLAYTYCERTMRLGPNHEWVLPPKAKTWYEWRIRYQDALMFQVHMQEGELNETWSLFYLRAEEIMDEDGVVDMEKATKIVSGEEV